MTDRTPGVWEGPESLVISLDLGTTQSAVSITHLTANLPIKARVVSRWPGAPNASKIPSVILFDKHGKPRAFGAETTDETFVDAGFRECKWFKLHLHPPVMQPPPYEAFNDSTRGVLEGPSAFEVPSLPPHVTVEQVYSYFIKYLFDNTKSWFEANAPDGDVIWVKLAPTLKLVLAHPNSWYLNEQAALKKAVARAAIFPAAIDVEDRVIFVTESEASVQFVILYSSNPQSEWLSPKSVFAVVDAGGSTVDTCMYEVVQTVPKLELRESKQSDCTQSGAIFVSRAAEEIIKRKLGKSKFNTPEYVAAMLAGFDTKTKLVFDGTEETYLIKFGFDRDTDKAVGISRGRLTLTKEEVTRAFEPCVNKVIQSLRDQISGLLNVNAILLVGGFGESPYLQRRLGEAFSGIRIVTADEPSKKAVAEGASLFYATENVVSRYTKLELGTSCTGHYEDVVHICDKRKPYRNARKERMFDGRWYCTVPRGASTSKNTVYRSGFDFHFKEGQPYTTSIPILGYDGPTDASQAYDGWCLDEKDELLPGFRTCCTITADLSELAKLTPTKTNADGGKYKTLEYMICILPGGTALKAEVRWYLDGVEHVGPAKIIPPEVHSAESMRQQSKKRGSFVRKLGGLSLFY